MAFRERPRETFESIARVVDDDRSAIEASRRARQAERLAQAKDRMAADVRSRPEDSSPAIRRLLGFDQPKREPRRWERSWGWHADGSFGLKDVEASRSPRPAGARDAR